MLFLIAASSFSQKSYEVLTPTDSTFQLKITEKGSRIAENAFYSFEMDTLSFYDHIFNYAWRAQASLARYEVGQFIADRERNRTRSVYNSDLGLSYFDSTAYIMFPRLSGVWRLKVDTLVEKVEVTVNNSGTIRVKTQNGYLSQLLPGVGINIRLKAYASTKIELKDLLGLDAVLYSSSMFQQSEQDETNDPEVENIGSGINEEEYYRYISIPTDSRKIVFKKLKHIDPDDE